MTKDLRDLEIDLENKKGQLRTNIRAMLEKFANTYGQFKMSGNQKAMDEVLDIAADGVMNIAVNEEKLNA